MTKVTDSLCSSHGKAMPGNYKNMNEVKCECYSGFSGKFCDYCKDS